MDGTAIVLTDGFLDKMDAKTGHGLIRGTERYKILAVIDPEHSGKDAGEVLDGKTRNIPVFDSVERVLTILSPKPDFCIVGVATVGGKLPPHMMDSLKKCLENGISLINGLHEFLTEKPELVKLAEENQATLTDVRKPKARRDLHFWSGEIFSVSAPIIAVMGLDCATGKRTTARFIKEACQKAGINAQMIYTGQTGWMQGGKYGFIFDSTLNDFISGELEHAIVSCWKETKAEVVFLEGQSALRNPSGPCGSEFLISGNAKKVILVYAPHRKYYDDIMVWGEIPSVESEIGLINYLGSEVIALSLNTQGLAIEEAKKIRSEYEKKLGIPVLLPLEEGVEAILPVIKKLLNTE